MNFNIPNIISSFRIVITPIFIYMFLHEDKTLNAMSSVVFLIGALSDYFDGWAARKFGQVSKWGQFLDPLADKLLVGSGFVVLSIIELLPWWMTLTIIVRDVLTTLLRRFALRKNYDMKTSEPAKYKTFLQFAFLAYVQSLIFFRDLAIFNFNNDSINEILISDYTWWAMLFLTAFTVFTMIDYIFKNRKLFKL